MTNLTAAALTNIANDLNACDLGIALTTGKVKQKYIAQRKKCMDAIKEQNKRDGLDDMTLEDIFAELES